MDIRSPARRVPEAPPVVEAWFVEDCIPVVRLLGPGETLYGHLVRKAICERRHELLAELSGRDPDPEEEQ